ncbi:MAG: molybdopterin-guanine dinucleotide biosynthesis protein MobB [Hyphomicrobium sp.]|nr:molybdopterin-guanine dinucleotide biosynthesis protein MobB [Hyphomicrobium sp.]
MTSNRLSAAKRANSTRRIDLGKGCTLVSGGHEPRAGDLVLARVDRAGHHDGVEDPWGRRATIYPGDEILVCYGNRYAPDQFEAVVPQNLGPCHLVAAGGLAAKALTWHTSMRPPTEITPIGLVADATGKVLNIRDFRIPAPAAAPHIPVILSIGTSMNSGKTTSAARIIKGLSRAGYRVGAAKVTGTSAGKDTWLMHDSGAVRVLDFNDAGFATTYMEAVEDVEAGAMSLVGELERSGAEIAVVEVADGLLQQETRQLLARPAMRRMTSAVVFSSVDSMGAVAGADWIRGLGYDLVTLAGVMTNSPLAAREAADATGLPVTRLAEFLDARVLERLFPFFDDRVARARSAEMQHDAICA